MRTFKVSTRKKDQIVDITDTVERYLQEEKNVDGLCSLFVAHTTCAITCSDLDPGTDLDLLDALRHLLPQLSYRHPHDPEHTPDHLLASIIGPSLVIPFARRQLQLGIWQRIILVELDGPRQRTMHMSTF